MKRQTESCSLQLFTQEILVKNIYDKCSSSPKIQELNNSRAAAIAGVSPGHDAMRPAYVRMLDTRDRPLLSASSTGAQSGQRSAHTYISAAAVERTRAALPLGPKITILLFVKNAVSLNHRASAAGGHQFSEEPR